MSNIFTNTKYDPIPAKLDKCTSELFKLTLLQNLYKKSWIYSKRECETNQSIKTLVTNEAFSHTTGYK